MKYGPLVPVFRKAFLASPSSALLARDKKTVLILPIKRKIFDAEPVHTL
jgi:hypothetical protein